MKDTNNKDTMAAGTKAVLFIIWVFVCVIVNVYNTIPWYIYCPTVVLLTLFVLQILDKWAGRRPKRHEIRQVTTNVAGQDEVYIKGK